MELILSYHVLNGDVGLEYFKHRYLAALHRGDKLLAHNALQYLGELYLHLLLLVGGEDVQYAVYGVGGAAGVESAQKQHAGLSRRYCGGNGVVVPHFTQKDDVGALTQSRAE